MIAWRRAVQPPRSSTDVPRISSRDGVRAHLEWDAAIELFIQGWGADHPGMRSSTLFYYRQQLSGRLTAFARERGITEVIDLSRYDLRAFVGWLEGLVTQKDKPLAPRGKQMALDTAKRFLRWLYDEGLVLEDITGYVKAYRLDRDPEPKATSGSELERILAGFDLGRPTGIRNTAMVCLMAFCGLRVSELVGLDGNDLDLDGGRVRVKAQTSKGRRTRFVDLPLTISEGKEVVKPEIGLALAAWLKTRNVHCPHLGGEDPLFVTLVVGWPRRSTGQEAGPPGNPLPPGRRMTTQAVRTILIRSATHVGVDPKVATPHRLRHHFGLMSAKAGVPTTALMRAMGHRSPLMTARYSEFADSERRWAFARADITKGIRLPEIPGDGAAAMASAE